MNFIRNVVQEVASWFRPARYRYSSAGQFTADGPQFGVEILNDDQTPMEFVVAVLQSDLAMSYESAVAAMLHIHDKGSVLLPAEDFSYAARVANAITEKARGSGHPLVCRAANAQQAVAADRPKMGSG